MPTKQQYQQRLDELTSLEEAILLDFYATLEKEAEDSVNELLLLFRNGRRRSGASGTSSDGYVYAPNQSVFIDNFLRSRAEASYSRIRNKLELIASEAAAYGDFTINVPLAAESAFLLLEDYLLQGNPQVRRVRALQAGQVTTLEIVSYVVPFVFARDVLAVLGGVQSDRSNGYAVKDSSGRYVVTGGTAVGMLYTGKKVLDSFSDDYYDDFGFEPNIAYKWVHITPPPRAFEPHRHLQGRIITRENYLTVLANPDGGIYYVGDHLGCRCFLVPVLR